MNTTEGPLLADLMHDIATVIRMIECTATNGTSAETGTAAEKKAIFDQVRSLAQRLLDLLSPGRNVIQFVDVGETVATIAETLHRTVGPGIRLHISICSGVPPLMCDPEDLKDAILNILVNARSTMLGHGILKLIVVREVQSLGGNIEEHCVLIRVESRTGIVDQNRQQIGCKTSTAEQIEENDCAPILELAREFAWQLGGNITVDDTAGVGMTVALRLPARITQADATSAAIRPQPA